MSTFQKVKLGDIANEYRDTYVPSATEDIPYIGLEHIEQQTLRLSGIGKSSDAMSQKKKFITGDVLYGSLRPYFRKVYKPNFDGVCSTDITVLKPKDNCNNSYLFYLIAGPEFISKASGAGTGTKMPRAGWKMIKNFTFNVPDLSTQTRIASVLSAYDDLIENNEKRIKTLEEMAQLLYTEWFVKFKFPLARRSLGEGGGYEKVKMIDSGTEYGMIPEGWEVKKLDDLILPQYGFTTSATDKTSGVQFLRGMDINKTSYINWSSVPYCEIKESDKNKYTIQKGDIFIIRMADPGKIGICEKKVDAIFASYLMRLKIKSQLTNYYLFYFLISEKYQRFVVGSSSGTTRKSINSKQVGTINILVPDQKTLENFEGKVSLLRSKITNLLDQNQNLSKTRDLLIPQLVTGRRELKN